jgi:hypothetical protein
MQVLGYLSSQKVENIYLDKVVLNQAGGRAPPNPGVIEAAWIAAGTTAEPRVERTAATYNTAF